MKDRCVFFSSILQSLFLQACVNIFLWLLGYSGNRLLFSPGNDAQLTALNNYFIGNYTPLFVLSSSISIFLWQDDVILF